MKFILNITWTAIVCLSFNRAGFAQTDSLRILGEKTAFYRQFLDSLPVKVKSGQFQSQETRCLLPEHYTYFILEHIVPFPSYALDIPGKLKDKYARVYALNDMATGYYTAKIYNKATALWKSALKISLDNGFTFEELHMFRPALNNNYFLAGDYPQAMIISTAGLSKAGKIKDRERAAHFNNVMGYIHMKQGNFTEAFRYYSSYLEISREIKIPINEAHALYNLGDLAIARGDYDQAVRLLDQSLKVYMTWDDTSGVKLFARGERESYVLNKQAEAHKLAGRLEVAREIILKVIRNIESGNHSVNEYDRASYYVNAGDIYNRLGIPDSAIYFANAGLAVSKAIRHREHARDAFAQLALAYSNKKEFDSAYYNYLQYSVIKDSLQVETSAREIFQHEASLQLANEQASTARQRILRNVILGISGFLLVILFLLYNRYRLRQKNKYQAELNRQQLEILRTTISVQDQERKRIAQDLHDSLGSLLSATKLKLSAISDQSSNGKPGKQQLADSISLLDEAILEMKDIAYNIMPATLSRLGLEAALQNLLNRLSSRAGLNINYTTYGFSGRLNETTELSIYRIVLEAVNNVVKHASARNLTVQLVRYPDYVNIMIEDDGIGFNTDGMMYRVGNGLTNIDSRIKNLKGTVHVDSREGSGTTIIAEIPLG